jgi:MFS family permease
LWWGQLISILGERLTYLALVGLLAEHTGHFRDSRSSLLLTVLANVMLAPVLILSPFTGAWVDRVNLKRVLVVSDFLRCLIVLAIPLAYRVTHHTGAVFVAVFLLFTCNVFFLPAKSAMTPEIVPPLQLLPANSLLMGAGVAATAVGALLGGWIIDHWGWAAALYLNGATYLVSVIALLMIRYRARAPRLDRPRVTLSGYLHEILEGWRVVRSHRQVGIALLALAAVWVGGGFLHVAGNLQVQRVARTPGMERVGVLLAVLGAGSALAIGWLSTRGRTLPRVPLLGAGLVLAGVGVFVFAISTRFAFLALAAFVTGIAAAPAFTLTETLLQESTEVRQRGRVFSARDFLMRLVFLLGVTFAGAATRALGTRTTLTIGAALIAATGMVVIERGARRPA